MLCDARLKAIEFSRQERLNAISALVYGFRHRTVTSGGLRRFIFGGSGSVEVDLEDEATKQMIAESNARVEAQRKLERANNGN